VAERTGLASLLGRGVDRLVNDVASLERLVQGEQEELVRVAIGRALPLGEERVPQILLGQWGQLSTAARNAVCSTLLRKSDWTRQLIEKVETEAIPRRDLDPSTVQQLRNYPDPGLRERAASVLGKPTERAPLVARYVQGLPSEFDAQTAKENGQKLYAEHCSVCHAPKPGQPALGPTVENLAHWTNEQWVTAVLDPNQTIEPKFQQSLVMTVDGQITAGIVVEKSSQSLKLATTDGRIQELALEDVEEIKQLPISLMPEGFEEKLSPQQLSEIMHFLRSQ
jgi:putative heme-binding domain-containing protein